MIKYRFRTQGGYNSALEFLLRCGIGHTKDDQRFIVSLDTEDRSVINYLNKLTFANK